MTEEAIQTEAEEPSMDMDAALAEMSHDLFPESRSDEEQDDGVDELVDEAIDEGGTENDEEEQEVVDSEEETGGTDALDMPKSWKKEMGEKWASIPKEVQQYVLDREDQMRAGLDNDRENAVFGRNLRDAIAPHRELLAQQGVNEAQAVQYMLNAHHKLSTGSPESRKAAFQALAQSYGFAESDANPEILDISNRISQIESNLTRQQQYAAQQQSETITKQVEDFASAPGHEHFETLADEIAVLINAGKSLDDAYRIAYRASDLYEADLKKQAAEQEAERDKAKQKELEKARKAKGPNVRGRDTEKSPTAKTGTMEDTLRQTFREIRSRNV